MRIFSAIVEGGVVKANGGNILDCPILGEGGDSSGYLVISESDLVYLPKISPDIKSFISETEDLCSKLEDLCMKITQLTVTCTAPGNPSSIPINSADFLLTKTDIMAINANLNNLKAALK